MTFDFRKYGRKPFVRQEAKFRSASLILPCHPCERLVLAKAQQERLVTGALPDGAMVHFVHHAFIVVNG